MANVEVTLTIEAEPRVIITDINSYKGLPGPNLSLVTYAAGEDISGHRAVYMSEDDTVMYADKDGDQVCVLGVTTQASIEGDPIAIQTFGEIIEPSWNWDVSKAIYLSNNGYLTQEAPISGIIQRIGIPINKTTMFVDIQMPIVTI